MASVWPDVGVESEKLAGPRSSQKWWRRGHLVGLSVCALALMGCQTDPPAQQEVAQPSASVTDDQPLCISGREVVRLSAQACAERQAAERSREGGVSNLLNNLNVEYETDSLDLRLLEAITIGARYRYQVERSYREGYFTRIDSYKIRSGANQGDLLGTLPLSIGLSQNSELLFAQQFASGRVARDPRSTYTPDHIPLTPTKALALKPGDYARFNGRMGLLANAGQVWPLAGYMLALTTKYSILVDGEYQVHVFRLDGDRIRVRLVADRGREASAGVALQMPNRVKAALINRVNAELQPLSSLPLLDASAGIAANKDQRALFLVDYTIDLSNPQAAAAYQSIFGQAVALQDLKIASPLRNEFELRDRLVGNIEELDRLAREDLEKSNQRVVRNFQGSNYSNSRSIDFDVKLSTFAVNRSRLYRENFLTRNQLSSEGDIRSHYLLPTWSHLRDRSMLFGMLSENQVRTADALFVADPDGKPIQFLNIGFGLEYKDTRLRADEYRRMRRKIELLLDDAAEQELALQLEGTPWLLDQRRRDISVSLRYFFHEAAFDGLIDAGYGNETKLATALAEFIVEGISNGEFPFYKGDLQQLVGRRHQESDGEDLNGRAEKAAAQRWGSEIRDVARQLAVAFNTQHDNGRRMHAVLDLRANNFYQKVGTAFWAFLVQRAELELSEVMFLNLRLAAKDHPSIDFSTGQSGERDLYESVKLIQSLLNDRSLDMREAGDLDAIISNMTIIRS